MTDQKGFSLLEVIVAMVLIASVGLGLYAWINTNLISLGRVQDHNQRKEAILNALDFMERVNPMEEPSGKAEAGPYVIQWETRLVEPERNGVGVTRYRFGLYNTEVRVERDEQEITVFHLRQVGYQPIYQQEDEGKKSRSPLGG
jgi:general secretion pathway protein I